MPASAPASLLLGRSNSSWLGVMLPLSLGAVGMPGCSLLAAPELLVATRTTTGQASASLSLPPAPWLIGVDLFAQGLVADPTANPLGAVMSEGLALTIGSR